MLRAIRSLGVCHLLGLGIHIISAEDWQCHGLHTFMRLLFHHGLVPRVLTISELFLEDGMLRDRYLSDSTAPERGVHVRTPLGPISYRVLDPGLPSRPITARNCHDTSTIVSVWKIIASRGSRIIAVIVLLLRDELLVRLSSIWHAPSHLLHLLREVKPGPSCGRLHPIVGRGLPGHECENLPILELMLSRRDQLKILHRVTQHLRLVVGWHIHQDSS